MELLADGPLHDHVLLVLVVLGRGLKVQLVVVGIRHHYFSSLHVHRNRQDTLQREVRILYVLSVHFFVLVE